MASRAISLTCLLWLNVIFFTLVSSHYVPCPPPPSPKSPSHHGGPYTPTIPTPSPKSPSHPGGHHGSPSTPKTPKSPSHPGGHHGSPSTPTIPPPAPTKPPPTPATPTIPTPTTPTMPSPTPVTLPTPPPSPTPTTPTIPPPTPTIPTIPPPTPVSPIIPPPTPTTPKMPPPSPTMGEKCPINTLKLAACANVLPSLLGVVLGAPPKSECCSLLGGLTDLDAAICVCTALEANILGIDLNIPMSLSVLLNFCNKAGVPSGFRCPSTPTLPPPTIPTMPPPTPTLPAPTPTLPPPTPTLPPTPTIPTMPPPTPTLPPPTPTLPPPPPTFSSPTPATPTIPPPTGEKCPINTLKLAACAKILPSLLDIMLGAPPKSECCSLLEGLTDLDAAICLCTALEANILGINLNIPVSLSVLLNFCNKAGVPSDFQCSPSPTISPPTPTTPPPPTPTISPPTPSTPTISPPTPTPTTPPSPPSTSTPTPTMGEKCPINTLKLAACANVLPSLLDVVLGAPPKSECCSLLEGLTDLDAAVCLCTALEANILGINLNIPVSLSVLLNFCNKAGVPSSFQCPTASSPSTPTISSPPTTIPTPIKQPPTQIPTPPTIPTPPSSMGDKCPINTLKLAACANVLPNLLDVVLGAPPKSQCCPLLEGLTDLDAALCLCTALKANILGIDLDVDVSLSVLLNFCNKTGVPSHFQCP